MNILPTIQSKYTTVSTVNTTTQDTSTYDEVAKKKQPTRYELLLSMNYDNMSEAERSELSHYNAMRPMPFLDEEGNKALNKALEGKTDAEKFSIKNMLQLEFTTSIKVNHSNRTIDREKFDSIDTSRSATVDRFENFMEDFHKNGSVDEIGLMDVMNKFLNIYKASDSSYDIKNQKDSVVDNFLEDLYSKNSSNLKSAIAKDEIENKVNEYAQLMMDENGDTPEFELEASKLLNEYKNELLQEYKNSLENAKNDKITPQQEAIIKVLLDENKKETSSLEKLIATTDVNKLSDIKELDDNHQDRAIPTTEELLDKEGYKFLNQTLEGMPEEDQIMIKLILSFQLSIKSESVVGDKLQIEREKDQLDTKDILKKLDLMIAKRKDKIEVNPLFTEKLDYVVDELKTFYTDKSKERAESISSNTNIQQTSKTLFERHMDALKDNTNTFGAFLKQNDKAMSMLDDFTKNMSEGEKGRFMFVFGGIGRESILKEAFERGISPSEAIPYVQKEIASFKDNTVFTKALEEIFTDKHTPDNEIKQQVREFYELYTS